MSKLLTEPEDVRELLDQLHEIKMLVFEYDSHRGDWSFRRGIIFSLLNDVIVSVQRLAKTK